MSWPATTSWNRLDSNSWVVSASSLAATRTLDEVVGRVPPLGVDKLAQIGHDLAGCLDRFGWRLPAFAGIQWT